MLKTRSWDDNLNDTVRDVLYPDAALRTLMLIPAKDTGNIKAFLDKYCMPDDMGAELLLDEKVRILHYISEGREIGDRVLKRFWHFDIYVKREDVYTATNDRLKRRDKLIAQRLRELLTSTAYVCNMRYRYEDDYDLGTKTAGYRRYHIVISYKTTG